VSAPERGLAQLGLAGADSPEPTVPCAGCGAACLVAGAGLEVLCGLCISADFRPQRTNAATRRLGAEA